MSSSRSVAEATATSLCGLAKDKEKVSNQVMRKEDDARRVEGFQIVAYLPIYATTRYKEIFNFCPDFVSTILGALLLLHNLFFI